MTGILAAIAGFPANVTISITDRTISRTINGTATATFQLNADGNVRNHGGAIQEIWCGINGTAAPSSTSGYEGRATLQSGTAPTSGTIGSWENLGTSRSWSNVNSGLDDSTITSVILVEIRNAATLAVVDSATITISATSVSGG
jgi:hypothetical protein